MQVRNSEGPAKATVQQFCIAVCVVQTSHNSRRRKTSTMSKPINIIDCTWIMIFALLDCSWNATDNWDGLIISSVHVMAVLYDGCFIDGKPYKIPIVASVVAHETHCYHESGLTIESRSTIID